jgi:hypothetical protein
MPPGEALRSPLRGACNRAQKAGAAHHEYASEALANGDLKKAAFHQRRAQHSYATARELYEKLKEAP